MTHDDVLFGYRLRLFTLAEELGSVSEEHCCIWAKGAGGG